jgi:hypothetical protein
MVVEVELVVVVVVVNACCKASALAAGAVLVVIRVTSVVGVAVVDSAMVAVLGAEAVVVMLVP